MKTINLIGFVGYDITNEMLLSQLPEDKTEPVRIFVDSIGGDAFEGFSIFNTLDKRSNVTVEIGARAFSAASYWPFAAETVIVNRNSTWMAHNSRTFAYGDRNELKRRVGFLEGIDNIIADTYSGRLEMSKKKVMDLMDAEFWLFGGQSIVDAGIGKSIREKSDMDEEMPEQSEVVNNFRAVFNEKMSHNKGQQPDWQLLNLTMEDYRKRKEPMTTKKTDETAVAPTNTPVAPVTNVVTMQQPTGQAIVPVVDNSALIANTVTAERNRTLELLNLAGVQLADTVKNAIAQGTDLGEYAIAQLKANRVNVAPVNSAAIKIDLAPTIKDQADHLAANQMTEAEKLIALGNAIAAENLKKK